MECSQDGAECGSGHGHCDKGLCLCAPGYASRGDLFSGPLCQVNVSISQTLWVLEALIWGAVLISTCYAIHRLTRRTKEAYINEVFVLHMLGIGSICSLSIGILETSRPGERAIGLDRLTTALYIIANSIAWLFLILNPLSRSQTGIGALALARVRRARGLYKSMVPILAIMCVIASCMPLVTLYGGTGEEVRAFFIILAVVLAFISVLHIVTLRAMHGDFTKALLSSAQELPPSQRVNMERIAVSTKRILWFPTIALLVIVPFLFCCALTSLVHQAWAILPVFAIMAGLWVLRYSNRSIKASILVQDKERDKTSILFRPTADIETNNSSGNVPTRPQNSHSSTISSLPGKLKPKTSSRPKFRLKGFKSKPMQLMSQVTEGNSEGTVRFTHVDGMETMDSSSSHYSRQITLSIKLEPSSPQTTHKSVSSVQSTLWEIDIQQEEGDQTAKYDAAKGSPPLKY